MAERCSCGSILPARASFCPNCGRPLVPGLGEVSQAPAPEPVVESAPRSASLADCLRAAVLPAACAVFLRFALGLASPSIALLAFGAVLPAGGAAVWRLTQRAVPVRSVWQGFGVGALTGLVCFLPSLLVQIATFSAQGRDAMLEAFRRQQEGSPMGSALVSVLEDPTMFAMVIAAGLFVEACSLAVVAGAGGALAAWTQTRAPA